MSSDSGLDFNNGVDYFRFWIGSDGQPKITDSSTVATKYIVLSDDDSNIAPSATQLSQPIVLQVIAGDGIAVSNDTIPQWYGTEPFTPTIGVNFAGDGSATTVSRSDHSHTMLDNATTSDVSGTLVKRDPSGNFNANVIYADSFVGLASSANKLDNARTISLTGDATGGVAFDGLSNVSIPVVIADDSHNHTVSNVDGLQTALDGKSDDGHNHDGDYQEKETSAFNYARVFSSGRPASPQFGDIYINPQSEYMEIYVDSGFWLKFTGALTS